MLICIFYSLQNLISYKKAGLWSAFLTVFSKYSLLSKLKTIEFESFFTLFLKKVKNNA